MVGEASDPSPSPPGSGMSDPSVPRVAQRAPQVLPGLRVTILAIILGVAACAMAFTALRSASKLWYSVLYTFTAFLLLTAVLASRFRRGNERAFWFGFAVFGWAFFLLGHRPWMSAFGDLADPSGPTLNPNLLSSRVILFLLPNLRKPTNSLGGIDEITLITLGIAHLMLALIVGIAGGLFAVVLRKRSRHRISVKSLAVLAGLALVGTLATSVYSARPSERFFPAGAFSERQDLSDFREEWYSGHLAAMGEPSLPALAQSDREATVYRLLWLPSFHHPVCVRIERTSEGARLHARVLDGKGGYEPGQIAIDRILTLDVGQWDHLDRLVQEAAFWELPTKLADDGGSDGDQLIVEGVKEGRYHVVDRWEPDPIYKALCGTMLKLTKIDLGKQWTDYHSDESSEDPQSPR
jgi:hypothetical protein